MFKVGQVQEFAEKQMQGRLPAQEYREQVLAILKDALLLPGEHWGFRTEIFGDVNVMQTELGVDLNVPIYGFIDHGGWKYSFYNTSNLNIILREATHDVYHLTPSYSLVCADDERFKPIKISID